MFEDVRDLYSDAIRAHSRAPRHAVRPAGFDATARGDNPMCGDRVTVFVRRDGDAVGEAGFEVRGCELTLASADIMCDAVVGMSADTVRSLAKDVALMARTGRCDHCDQALHALSAVHGYPSRLRCVTLPWSALVAALDGKETASD